MDTILKRYVAFIGLLALIPIGYMLVSGRLTAMDAGVRGAMAIVAVFILRALASLFGASASASRKRSRRAEQATM